MSRTLIHTIEELAAKGIIKINDPYELEGYAADYALSLWSIDDVRATAKENGLEITAEDAQRVVEALEDDHDASIGINWDVIKYTIENLGI